MVDNIKTNEKGLTLIEILVAVTIFTLIIGISSTLFIFASQVYRRISAEQELLAQTNYVMEYMSRTLRMAKKDLTGNCIDLKHNYQVIPNGIRFLNFHRQCQEFSLQENQIKERRSSDLSKANLGAFIPLTSDRLRVVSFNIRPFGWGQEDDLQPRVTIFLRMEDPNFRPELRPKVKIQTTISQRDPDIGR